MSEPTEHYGASGQGALERSQTISQRLSEAARRARFSSRARGAFQKTGFEGRRGARAMRIVGWVLFGMLVGAPNLVSVIYYGFIASDQYVSEARFTVSSGALPKLDAVGSVTGVPPMMIVQDTQIVTNFIESRAIVEELDAQIGLRDIYGSSKIDWFSRFRRDKPIEKFVDYWEKMAIASISFPSGIVNLSVRAFKPEDSKLVADAIVARCEALINGLNDRMRADTILASEQDLARAGEQVSKALLALKQARDKEGIVDVATTSKTFGDVLAGLEADLLRAQQEYSTQLRYVSESAPQMRVLRSRVQSMQAQIEDVRSKLTAQQQKSISAIAEQTLAGKMTTFANLELEKQIAEKRYASAAASLNAARILSERKMLYLHQVVSPALPEEARYPKRGLSVLMIFVASLISWVTILGCISFIRNNMA